MTIQSMTAVARVQIQDAWGSATWEIRSVNHRYLDLSFYLPEDMRLLEVFLRDSTIATFSRGKIDCKLQFKPSITPDIHIQINKALVKALTSACDEISTSMHSSLNPLEVLRWPGVVSQPEVDITKAQEAVKESFARAMKDFIEAREREGSSLKELLEQRATQILQEMKSIPRRSACYFTKKS